MAIHDEVLNAALRICRARGGWTFRRCTNAPVMVVELEADAPDPVIASYEQHIDRTLVRQALQMTHEQRLRALQRWIDGAAEIRGGAKGARSRRRREAG